MDNEGLKNLEDWGRRMAEHQGRCLELIALKEHLRGGGGGDAPALRHYVKTRELELQGQLRLLKLLLQTITGEISVSAPVPMQFVPFEIK